MRTFNVGDSVLVDPTMTSLGVNVDPWIAGTITGLTETTFGAMWMVRCEDGTYRSAMACDMRHDPLFQRTSATL